MFLFSVVALLCDAFVPILICISYFLPFKFVYVYHCYVVMHLITSVNIAA